MCERLVEYGQVVGTDLADEVIARAQARVPAAEFVAGDFMSLDFGRKFDVVVSQEVLSHVADQPAFIAKLASVLRPGGELLLATQNRWVLQRSGYVRPQGKGQLRHWVSRAELRRLLRPHFAVLDMTTLTPLGHGGILRLVNSTKLTMWADRLFGSEAVKRLKERLGCGWTIMVRARLL